MEIARLAAMSAFLLLGVIPHCSPASAADVRHYPLKEGVLAVPGTVEITDGSYDLVLHLHGAPKVVEPNLAVTNPQAVWVNLTLPGLSSVYRRHFQNSTVFPALLSEIEQRLASIVPDKKLHRRHLTVTSFSGGFGGVRELLKQPESRSQIDTLVMADSLYGGFVGEIADRTLNPDHLTPFFNFAQLAASGQKQMLLSHTELHTPDYASTKETANYLIRKLGTQPRTERKVHPGGLIEKSRCTLRSFVVMSFEGTTAEDHMKHLRHIRIFLQEVNEMAESN